MYVERRQDGSIKGVYRQPQPGYAEEWVEDAEVAPELEIARRDALISLLEAVTNARQKYAPNAAHQTVIYDVKAQEADAYIAAGRPADASPFPLLAASAAANERSVSDHADAIIAKRAAWIAIAAGTEQLREAGENAIKAASDLAGIETARAAYVGQLAQI